MRASAIVENYISFVLAGLGFVPTHASVVGEVDSRPTLVVSDKVGEASGIDDDVSIYGPGSISTSDTSERARATVEDGVASIVCDGRVCRSRSGLEREVSAVVDRGIAGGQGIGTPDPKSESSDRWPHVDW
jgi:hypothetical protein